LEEGTAPIEAKDGAIREQHNPIGLLIHQLSKNHASVLDEREDAFDSTPCDHPMAVASWRRCKDLRQSTAPE
jgi:hypothetical protein